MVRKLKLLVLGCLISVACSAPVFANETSTTSTDSAINECYSDTRAKIGPYTNKIAEILSLRTQIKMTKTELNNSNKTINKLSDVLAFDCSKISQTAWESIKLDRQKNLTKAIADFDKMYNMLMQRKPMSISCYKDGVIKTISGKQPVCPKGFKKLS